VSVGIFMVLGLFQYSLKTELKAPENIAITTISVYLTALKK